MFNVLFREQATEGIRSFVIRYEQCFADLFHDSGIWSENVILEKYRIAATDLGYQFSIEIHKRLQSEVVLGRKKLNTWFEISFHVDTRLIVAYYTEDKKEHTRTVEWIGINRKDVI